MIALTHTSDSDPELLRILGFNPDVRNNPAEVEDARLRMCAHLQLDTTLPDSALAAMARRAGYDPSGAGQSGSKTSGGVDRSELAQLGRATKTGLQSVHNKRSTQTGMRSINLGGNKSNSSQENIPAVNGEQPSAEDATTSAAASNQEIAGNGPDPQTSSMRLKQMAAQTSLDEPKEGVLNKIKKLFGR